MDAFIIEHILPKLPLVYDVAASLSKLCVG
jgi:hypothetical protein